jgi:hypothetical protein
MSRQRQSKARTSPRKVHIDATAKGLTSQAGLIPVVKFLHKIGAQGAIQRHLHVERGASATYDIVDALLPTVIALVGGARSLAGVVTVWADGVLRKVSGWMRVPDATTLGRILKALRPSDINDLETLNHGMRGRVWKMALRAGLLPAWLRVAMTIDLDSTVKTVFGSQEGAKKGYNPHKRGALSYHPLLAFCAQTKEILQGWFRSGDAYTSNGTVEFTKQLLAHLPHRIRIFFRADSGFFDGKTFDLWEERGHGYLVKVKMKGLVGLLSTKVWSSVAGQPGWEYCEFQYACHGWQKSRRFVAVRNRVEPKGKKAQLSLELGDEATYEYFCYVTTEDLTPWQAHKTYGQRATSETWIDEAKNQMGLAHIKTDTFLANAALFQCAIVAYNTARWMALCSGNSVLRTWEIQTIRTFLIRVAGKLLTGGNQLQVKTPESPLYLAQWDAWVAVGMGVS